MNRYYYTIVSSSLFVLVFGHVSNAQGLLPPNVSSACSGEDIAGCMITLYKFGVSAVAVLAFVVLVWGGFVWLTSGGNMSRVDSAKEWIMGSILGLIIALGSFILLNTINPQLTSNFKLNIEKFSDEDFKTGGGFGGDGGFTTGGGFGGDGSSGTGGGGSAGPGTGTVQWYAEDSCTLLGGTILPNETTCGGWSEGLYREQKSINARSPLICCSF
jgi:uncharacterized membrane protein YgcG